ncbi:GATA-4/5/6 transcription factor [Handroanthus impetiginosus]|uniref:GATA-4/5/6 transcription factor n=1 Tax=Handroanthus impetiginosus TaxID=429701 RepID=A0A2G9GD59_9LAMI|nr:GATA-4/5/6 transcription factor [Handroanthus impetiginosus]
MDVLRTAEECLAVDDDLLNFTLEGEEEGPTIFNSAAATAAGFGHESQSGSSPEIAEVEEELEWLSNKDAFPTVETCFGILSENPDLILSHRSPVSVLENNNSNSNSPKNTNSDGNSIASYCNSLKVPTNHPVRSRSKRRTRRRSSFSNLTSEHRSWPNQELLFLLPSLPTIKKKGAGMGRRCFHCQADKTPQWRAGPMGPKTLCNACGVRYKSGRLLPEYRPANSPTFSSFLHSNSHKKVVEIRKKKQSGAGEGIATSVACGYSVG